MGLLVIRLVTPVGYRRCCCYCYQSTCTSHDEAASSGVLVITRPAGFVLDSAQTPRLESPSRNHHTTNVLDAALCPCVGGEDYHRAGGVFGNSILRTRTPSDAKEGSKLVGLNTWEEDTSC